MAFLYPWFLWSLVLVAIPVVIHLFNFRVYKPVYFSNLDFLKDIKEASESKSKLKQLLILLLRILTIIALAIAFAGPYIPLQEKNTNKSEVINAIYLDNSFSMNAQGQYGNIFDAGKERARSILSEYDYRQQFLFTDNDFKSIYANLLKKDQLTEYINQSKLSGNISQLSDIMDFIERIVKKEMPNRNIRTNIFLISDFQKISSDFMHLEPDSSTQVFLIPLSTAQVNNLYIDSLWFDSPQHSLNKAEELKVRIVNAGTEAYQDISIKLFINGKEKALSSFDIEAGAEQTVSLNFVNTQSGIITGNVEITDYPVTYDNTFYFTYSISKETKILIINDNAENKYLEAIYQSNNDFQVDFQASGNIKSNYFVDYQTIILDELKDISSGLAQELSNFVEKGGTLCVIPATDIDLESYNNLFGRLQTSFYRALDTANTEISKINYQHYLYRNVFKEVQQRTVLPKVNTHYKTGHPVQNTDKVLLSALNGDDLLIQGNLDKGKYYLFSFPLNTDNTGFYLHPLFVPTLYNMAAFSQSLSDLYYTLGNLKPVRVNTKIKGDDVLRVVASNSNYEFIPRIITGGRQTIKIDFMNQIQTAGNYFLLSGKDTLSGLSFNYNRKESDTRTYTLDEISSLIKQYKLDNFKILSAKQDRLASEVRSLTAERKNLWKLFLIFALIFLIGEILLIKFWKE